MIKNLYFIRKFCSIKLYSKDHELYKYNEATKECFISITDFAQDQLGEIVYIELIDGERIVVLEAWDEPTQFSEKTLLKKAKNLKSLYFMYEIIIPALINFFSLKKNIEYPYMSSNLSLVFLNLFLKYSQISVSSNEIKECIKFQSLYLYFMISTIRNQLGMMK